ncbi:hypothetical protein ACWD3J_12740 [Streptomyces sp. NPDC002755]|uniref:hypothetical protein n=1 Tax=Streptomyces sp. NPDC002884 TaxID=3154544 RepID=UPI0033241CE9
MNLTPRKSRRRPGAVRAVVLGVCAAGALSLTGCSGDGGTASAGSGVKPSATTATGTGDTTGADAGTTGKKPGAEPSTSAGSDVKSPSVVPIASKSPAPPTAGTAGAAGSGGGGDSGGDDCDHKMPISPDEVAVYRYTPEGGSLSLIVRHGNWGCGTPDSDGAPFETVGKETYIPMDQAADVTVTNPIVESTENQPIGVQEFLDWLEAHPNSGLVFTYHLGSDGAIDRLDEVFTP